MTHDQDPRAHALIQAHVAAMPWAPWARYRFLVSPEEAAILAPSLYLWRPPTGTCPPPPCSLPPLPEAEAEPQNPCPSLPASVGPWIAPTLASLGLCFSPHNDDFDFASGGGSVWQLRCRLGPHRPCGVLSFVGRTVWSHPAASPTASPSVFLAFFTTPPPAPPPTSPPAACSPPARLLAVPLAA